MTNDELKDRIEAKKLTLQARLTELEADTRAEASKQRDAIEHKLHDLEDALKDGWDKVSERISAKLQAWLKN